MNSELMSTSVVALLVVLVLFLLMNKKWKISTAQICVNLPPGPKTLPIIGNLHLLSLPPFRSFRHLSKQFGPLMLLKLGETPAIIVSSPETAKQILKDNDPNFTDRPQAIAIDVMWYNYTSIAFCPFGEYWKQMRRICILELLSAKNVRSFGSIRHEEVSHLIESIRASYAEPLNLSEKLVSMVSSVTCRAAFGKVCKDNKALISLVREGIRMSTGFLVADFFPSSKIINALSWPTRLRLLRMRRKLDVILDDIINDHKERGRHDSGNGEFGDEDLVDVFLRIEENGEMEFPIANDNIKAVICDMFAAGTETSSTIMDWAMTELLRHPRVMAKAQAEVREIVNNNNITQEENVVHKLKYLKLVIKETLRLHPPIPMLPRASREEREINGYIIPAKVKVLVNIWAIQRDPKYWTNPESFEPERFDNQPVDFTGGDFKYLPLGSGKRMCPGMTFGMASVDLPLAQLLYNFNWKLPDGVKPQDLDMIEDFALSASRKQSLYVVATPYLPLA